MFCALSWPAFLHFRAVSLFASLPPWCGCAAFVSWSVELPAPLSCVLFQCASEAEAHNSFYFEGPRSKPRRKPRSKIQVPAPSRDQVTEKIDLKHVKLHTLLSRENERTKRKENGAPRRSFPLPFWDFGSFCHSTTLQLLLFHCVFSFTRRLGLASTYNKLIGLVRVPDRIQGDRVQLTWSVELHRPVLFYLFCFCGVFCTLVPPY